MSQTMQQSPSRRAARASMRSGFQLGRIFGIAIHVDPSWIFIFLLVTWNLAGGVIPQIHPDWSPALQIGTALVASLLFFASVLAHELSHSLVAQARGLPVKRITLFLFGGVSNIEREPSSPSTEFLMAVVGPATSLVLGFLFLLAGGSLAGGAEAAVGDPMSAFARLGPLATLLLWLGPINIVLGLFNLVPGFPLDGGRILRSILWAATKDLSKATRWASRTGQAFGWLFIVTGIAMAFGARVPVFGTGLIGGLWLAFIGWFLNSAAAASYQQVLAEDLLEDVPVARLMRVPVATVPAETSVSDLVDDWMLGTDEHSFPVVEDGRLAGFVSLEDVRRLPRGQWDRARVRDVMTPFDRLAVVRPEQDAAEALQALTSRDVRQLPVVENGRLVGLLRRRDILRWLQLHESPPM